MENFANGYGKWDPSRNVGSRTMSTRPKLDNIAVAPWWMNPFWFLLFFMMPLYWIVVGVSASAILQLGEKGNYLNSEGCMLGSLSIAAMAAGCLPSAFKMRAKPSCFSFSLVSVNRVLLALGLVVIVSYAIALVPVVPHWHAAIQLLLGDRQAMYMLGRAQMKIPGLTSFENAGMPLFCLYGFVSAVNGTTCIWRINRWMMVIIWVLVLTRAFVGSERIALIQVLFCYLLPRLLFRSRRGFFRSSLPICGVAGMFGIFSLFEYFRSWQYYKNIYDSYFDFVSVRFFGYFATSINNGAGFLQLHGPFGYPVATVAGFYKMALIFGSTYQPFDDMHFFLLTSASPEFNNPGGLFVPYMDFGVLGGLAVFVLVGAGLGQLYRLFLWKAPLGVLLFPPAYIGLLDIMRVFTWGDPEFIVAALSAVVASVFLTQTTEKNRILETARGVGTGA
jgi:oligosaccharide repeat unit polymerase